MDSAITGILSCPNETLLIVLGNVSLQDLACVRQCCRRLSQLASPVLFKTVSTSLDNLHQFILLSNSRLAAYVETLTFYEISYDMVRSAHDPWPHSRNSSELETLKKLIQEYHGLDRSTSPPFEQLTLNEVDADNSPPPRFNPDWGLDFVEELICNVLLVYKRKDEWQSSEAAFLRLYVALQGLDNLKEIHVKNMRDGGLLKSVKACRELKELNDYFPLSEASFYMIFQETKNPPQKGFLMIMMVLSVLKRNISLTVRHGLGLMRQGIDLMAKGDVNELHLQDFMCVPPSDATTASVLDIDIAKGFKHLTKLDLDVTPNHGTTETIVAQSLLATGITQATSLEELCVGMDGMLHSPLFYFSSLFPMFNIEAGSAHPKMKTILVEKFSLKLPECLSRTLKARTPALRQLSFIECVLEDQRWREVVQELSNNEYFTLDEFRLESSRCLENTEKEDSVGIDVPVMPSVCFLVSSFIGSRALTRFINTPGSTNPLNHRKRRFFDRETHEDIHATSQLVEQGFPYADDDIGFDDVSEWTPEEQMAPGREADDEDTDGPEFDEDYDFSAEEGSDDEMDIDVDKVRIEGSEVETDSTIHVHRNKRERGILPPRTSRSVSLQREMVELNDATRNEINAMHRESIGGDIEEGMQSQQPIPS